MKALLCIFMLLLASLTKSNKCIGQDYCDSVFAKEYTSTGHINPFTVKTLVDNDIVVAGRASLTPSGSFQLMAAKFSSNGSVKWSVLLGGNNEDNLQGVVELADNSLLFYGVAASFGFNTGKVLLIRLSANGNLIWARQMGLPGNTKNIIKDLKQSADGDITGTFNLNDSSSLSEPVVFKMGLDGTMRWSRKFNNPGDDSFTALSELNNQIYLVGYSTTTRKQGVLVTLNASDGSLVNSQSPYYRDTSYQQELIDVEVYNNRISFGIFCKKTAGNSILSKLLLYQSDLAGNQVSQRIASLFSDPRQVTKTLKRSHNNGFFLLHISANEPTIVKFNPYFNIDWSTRQTPFSYYVNEKGNAFDRTAANGSVSASWYKSFSTNNQDRLVITKTSVNGLTGNCTQPGNTLFTDTVFTQVSNFIWADAGTTALTLNESLPLIATPLLLNASLVCDTASCIDTTPLPLPCNKTSLVEYGGHYSSKLRDAVTLSDGGSIAVGEFGNQGFVMRTGNNGDVVWSKMFDETARQAIFMRVLKADGNNVFAFANNYYVVDHYAYRNIKVVKLDPAGNILLSKEISSGWTGNNFEIGDVCATPDGGFIVVINWGWGIGYLYSYVIRFSSSLNIIWQKELKHFVATPVYRSITCDGKAVYIGHDTYDSYNQNKVGIQKLDYTTGNNVWSHGYTMSTTMLRLSKILAINDTVYTFINRYQQIDFSNYDFKIVMLKVESNGNMISANTLNTDNLEWPTSFATQYFDFSSPVIALAADSNFVMSHGAKNNNTSVVNISKFDKYANSKWSKNYAQLNRAGITHVKTHDSSIVITGAIIRPTQNSPNFRNTFLLKTNNQGNIVSTATGICLPEERPFSASPATVVQAPSGIDSVVSIDYFSLIQGANTTGIVPYDATLYCNQVAYCSTVRLTGNTAACSLNDTIKLYTENNNCDAVIRLNYDTSFLTLYSHVNDTIKLLPKHQGVSTIYAAIESPCLDTLQLIQVSVLLSANAVNIGTDTSLCAGTSITLNAGNGYHRYVWQDGSTDSVYQLNQPGIYWVQVDDFCGNTFRDSITVLPYNEPISLGSDRVKCNADTLHLVAPGGFIRYEWSNDYNINTLTGQQVIVFPLIDTVYYLRAEKLPGCFSYDTVRVQVNTSPPINLGADTRFCTGDSLMLNAGNGFIQYQWNTGNTTPVMTIHNAGTYWLTATAANSCISRDTITIAPLYTLPVINLGADAPLCIGDSRTFDAGNGYTQYVWNNGSTTSTITASTSGIYAVRVTDVNGCNGTDTVRITQLLPLPAAFLSGDTSICNYGSISLKPVLSYNQYVWSTGSTQSSVSINKPGIYWLQVKDNNNCVGTDSIIVTPKECTKGLFVPSGFTPNNDGKNDIFKPFLLGNVVSYRFTIYNRWGEPVFHSVKVDEGWNGMVNGVPTDSNVFIWQCTYQLQGEATQNAKGTVTLIR